MNPQIPQGFSSFQKLWDFYCQPDEYIFTQQSQCKAEEIAALREATRQAAQSLRIQYATKSAAEIAQIRNIEIIHTAWEVADGHIIFFAESHLCPPQITLNTATIKRIAERGNQCAMQQMQCWFTCEQIIEVILAHELYHIFTQQPSSPMIELAAHIFARTFTRLPFSPLLYQALLITNRPTTQTFHLPFKENTCANSFAARRGWDFL